MNSDVFLSVGWMDSNKEVTLSKVKAILPDFYICYQVYDTILLNEDTSFFYPPESKFKFQNYLKWISHNADLVFYGGRSTMKDAQQVEKTNSWPVPDAIPLKFGTDISKSEHTENEETEILGRLGLNSRFIMTVGTIEPRKNHLTVFRAYQLLIKEGVDVPVLVVCGKPSGMVNDMLNQTKNDPSLKDRILFLSPTDEDLAVLYKHCLFTVLPTLSEGWSLTLPESLSYGKYCLCSDIPPLREIANDLVDFVEPYNVRMWADSIKNSCDDLAGLKQKQEKIAKDWEKTTWKDTAGAISNGIAAHTSKAKARTANPEIWFDLTTSFLHANGNMSGIVRVELSYAKAIYEMYANVHFFAYWDGDLFEINIGMLSWLFDSLDIESSFKYFDTFWRNRESSGTGHRVPYADDTDVANRDKYVLRCIGNQSLVLLVNIDWGLAWTRCIVTLARQSNSTVAQFIHDVTPIIVPHLHRKETCDAFTPFFEFCSNEMDFLHYGGKVAQSDGIAVQKAMGWKSPPSEAMKLASDFILQNDNPALEESLIRELGINGDFIITVGTLEPRKNHEVLYKAYLHLLESGNHSDVPMMIFLGKPGWNSDDLLTILGADKRVAGKIRILSPNDQQLDALYKKCLFAVLPSFYEGYSLTLNEILGRGKFCIASDTPPLREVGAEFAEYVDPLDCNKWAERILHHSRNKSALNAMEAKIAQNWRHITWVDSARELVSSAQAEMRRKVSNGAVQDG
jgi:glycosyltransferase involved in cell wall biosynthesis